MAIFVSDTMTGTDNTNLTSHTGEIGATWTFVTGFTGLIRISTNRIKGYAGGVSLAYASGSSATAEYDIEVDMYQLSDIDQVGICGRLSTGAFTCYVAWYNHPSNRWELSKTSSSTGSASGFTSLGTYVSDPATAAVTKFKLELRDAAKKLYVHDGSSYVERISSADNTITAAGKVGVYWENSDWDSSSTAPYTLGRALDNFTATDAGGAAFIPQQQRAILQAVKRASYY